MAKCSLQAGSLAEMTGEAGTGVPGYRGGGVTFAKALSHEGYLLLPLFCYLFNC